MNARDVAVAPGTGQWAERNRQWLMTRIADLRRRLAADGRQDPAPQAPEVPDDEGFTPALRRLQALFGLSGFESDVLLLCAGIELDADLRRLVATWRATTPALARATFGLAFATLPDAHWDSMSPSAPLRHWRLLALENGATLSESGLHLDERVLHYLTGVDAVDPGLFGLADLASPDGSRGCDDTVLHRVAAALRGEPVLPPLFVLDADPARAANATASLAALLDRLGVRLLVTKVHDLSDDARELAETSRLLDREAALKGALVLVQLDPAGAGSAEHEWRAVSLVARLRSPVALMGRPSRQALAALPRRRVHRLPAVAAVEPRKAPTSPALHRARQQFRLEAPLVDAALADLPSVDDGEAVWQALREAARGGLDALAQRIDSQTALDDLVLPAAQKAALRDITRQLRHRERVYDEWGFAAASSRGLGLCALFAGESGTGKTMAAEAIANEAKLDLYRVDLAGVVSKYIGETEKNLERVFDAAEASGAVLLFDEADALFGRRSEVKDSHDRYANIETAYLLQRIEAYRGLAILTSNMRSALDRAFLRRIRFVVQFPFPDARAREELWRRQFPPAAPVDGIDCAALARLQLAGGHIRAIAINAAFKAADAGQSIGQALLMDAARAEFAKLERSISAGAGA